jgi:hypothetical protein
MFLGMHPSMATCDNSSGSSEVRRASAQNKKATLCILGKVDKISLWANRTLLVMRVVLEQGLVDFLVFPSLVSLQTCEELVKREGK